MSLGFPSQWTALLVAAGALLVSCAEAKEQVADAARSIDAGVDIDAMPSACADEPCWPNVSCADIAEPPGYSCGECPAGYDGDGETCTDFDACQDEPCDIGVSCTDRPPPDTGFDCSACPAGTEGDGLTCTDVDGCAGDPCFLGVACVDVPAPGLGYTCGTCPSGLEGDGETCVEIDGCANDPCFDDVSCVDVPAPGIGYTCGGCPPGHTGDGETCTLLCDPSATALCGSTLAGSNVGASDLVDDWECSTLLHTGPEIMYRFVAPESGMVTATLDNLGADLDLFILADSSLGDLCDPTDPAVCVPGGYSGKGGTSDEQVRWSAQAGRTYYIVVDGYNGNTSAFDLTVGTDTRDILLGEIGLGLDDYVELVNRGACSFDLGGLTLLHDPSLAAPMNFTFPNGTDIAGASVFRMVESTSSPFLGNEISAGQSIPDLPDGVGFTALCNGTCDTASCSNVLDYVERDDNLSDAVVPEGPTCASFQPDPIFSDGQTSTLSLHRTAFGGAPTSWAASDWTFGAPSRD